MSKFENAARVQLRIKELKFIDPPWDGWSRSYWRCKRHGRVAYRDFLPFSLSNPIIGALACGCSGHPSDGQIEKIGEDEALNKLLEQHLNKVRDSKYDNYRANARLDS